MGRGEARRAGRRRRVAALAATLAASAAALTTLGCGAASHPNEARPQPPTRVSVTISPGGVTVQPSRIAFGGEQSQQLPQNRRDPQPRIQSDRAVDVVIVAANQTGSKARLRVDGPAQATSGPLYPDSPGTLQTALPSGTYTISAAGVPGAGSARLVVGPVRTSSENDVLLP
ncbi:MAG: hypothetical protein ACM3NV_11380 [Syntrophothermus sp.]